MSLINSMFSEKIIDSIGWTLFHSLWQGIVITLIFGFIMISFRKYSASIKYIIGIIALLFMFSTSLVTFVKYYESRGDSNLNHSKVDSSNKKFSNIDKNAINSGNVNITNRKSVSSTGIPQFFSNYFKKHFPLIVSLWLGGLLFLVLKFTGGFLYTRRYRHKMIKGASGFWYKKFSELKERVGYKKNIVLLSSGLVKVPMVIGFFKPILLFPASMFSGMPVQQIEAIMAHELAHILRRDYFINILQTFLDIIYFYHPGIRWISSMIRFERENSCDDIAIEISGDSKEFAKALSGVQTYGYEGPGKVMAISGNKNQLFKRISRIVNRSKSVSGFSEGFFAASLLGLSIFVLAFTNNISGDISDMLGDKNTIKNEINASNNIIVKNKEAKTGAGFILLKKTEISIDGVLTNKDNFYKKIKLVNEETGKIVWKLKKKKLTNWGPVFRFKDKIKLKKGEYNFLIIGGDNSFALIFRDKNKDNFAASAILKAGENNLADKMIDLFYQEEMSKYNSNTLFKRNNKEFLEKELAMKKEQGEYEEQRLAKKKAEIKHLEEYFKQKNKGYFSVEKTKNGYIYTDEKKMTRQLEFFKKHNKELIEKQNKLKAEEIAKQKYEIQLIKEEEKKRKKEVELIEVEKQIKKELEKRSRAEREVLDKLNEVKEKEKRLLEEEQALIEIEKEKIEQRKFEKEKQMELEKRELELKKIEKEKQEMREKEIAVKRQEKEIAKRELALEKFEEIINKKLFKDKLIKKGEKFSFEFSYKKGLFLNGVKLNKKLNKKYKQLFEKNADIKLSKTSKIVFSGKYSEGD